MSVISVKLIGRGRGGSMDTGPTTRLTDVYQVVTNDKADDSLTVLEAVDPTSGLAIPALTDAHPTEPGMTVEAKRDQPDSRNAKRHEVSVEYSTRSGDLPPGEEDPNQDPTLDSPIVTIRSFISSVTGKPGATGFFLKADATWTTTRVAIANSAFETYRDESDEVADAEMIVEMNRADAAESAVLLHTQTWANVINNVGFMGYAEGLAKVMAISATHRVRNEIIYWKYVYRIGFRLGSWYTVKLDEGTYELNLNGRGDSKKDSVPIIREGQPITEPIPLDGLGGVLNVEEEAVYTTSQVPFDSYEYRQFSKPARGDLNDLPFMTKGVA